MESYVRYFQPQIGSWGVVQPVDAEEKGFCWYYAQAVGTARPHVVFVNVRLIVYGAIGALRRMRTKQNILRSGIGCLQISRIM